ncbi:MAG: hypothetical protein CL681_05905 [Blastopirellula sp.]|nr:hypothetical protein [Blastopirellula sp.]
MGGKLGSFPTFSRILSRFSLTFALWRVTHSTVVYTAACETLAVFVPQISKRQENGCAFPYMRLEGDGLLFLGEF